jgi:predicted RNA-binding Zn-ribbon protein involved in translation (DUF1610 family)
MAAAPKENLGRFPCPCCGEPVALKRSGTMKLSFVCEDADCEMSGYANPHTGAARKWLSQVVKRAACADPAPAASRPASKPEATKPAQEAPKPANPAPTPNPPEQTPPRRGFDLAELLKPRKQ